MKKNRNKEESRNASIVVLNQPIDDIENDNIGMHEYLDALENAIDKGANIIGIEADFGTGKSSLIALLKKRFANNKEVISVNMWHIIDGNNYDNNMDLSKKLHRSFLYQAISSKEPYLGSYISRRLSSDYGLFSFVGERMWQSILFKAGSFCMVIALLKDVFKLVLAKIVDKALQILVTFNKIDTNDFNTISSTIFQDGGVVDSLQVLLLILGFILLTIVLCSGEIVFSSSKSNSGRREIDDTVIVDLFRKEFYRKGKNKHYIFVIEDLDRTSDMSSVRSFIKELRRYYFIEKNRTEVKKNNKVTFIICIKPETLLNSRDRISVKNKVIVKGHPSVGPFYTKVFDYIISLPNITGDNKEAILCGILNTYKEELVRLKLIDSNDVDITMNTIKGLQWIVHGKKASIRDVKNRLNQALISYNRTKTIGMDLSDEELFQKCAAAVYFKNEHEKDYIKLTESDIDTLLDGYVRDRTIATTATDLKISLSEACIEDFDALLGNKLIDYNYRCYFYNIPKNAKLYNKKQLSIYNSIVYNEQFKDIQIDSDDKSVVYAALSKREELGLLFPEFVVEDKVIYNVVVKHFWYKLIELIKNRNYDINNISAAKAFVMNSLLNIPNFNRQSNINDILSALIASVVDKNCLVEIRKEICKTFRYKITDYILLFKNDNPFITEEEVQLINSPEDIIKLMDFNKNKTEMNEKSFIETHSLICSLTAKEAASEVIVSFYENAIDKFGLASWNGKIIDWLTLTKVFPNSFVGKYKVALDEDDIPEAQFIAALGCCEIFTEEALALYSEKEWSEAIPESLSNALYDADYILDYIIGEIASERNTIDFTDNIIKNSIESGKDYLIETEFDKFQIIRRAILRQSILISQYDFLFSEEYPINGDELLLISRYEDALMLLGNYGEKKCLDVLAEYFSNSPRKTKATYEILKYIFSLPISSARRVFYSLDMKMFSYGKMNKKQREEIDALICDRFELLDNPDEIIRFLSFVKVSIPLLESESVIASFNDEQRNKYVTFANSLTKIEDCTLNNILKFTKPYIFSDVINEKLYDLNYYITYISSKVRGEKIFRVEDDKKSNLWKSYVRIFNMKGREQTQKFMRENHEFVDELIEQNEYLNAEERITNYSFGSQTKELLEYVFANFDLAIVLEYLRNIYRFNDKDAAHCFVQNVVNNDDLLFDDAIYDKCYDLLIDPGLKGWYTRRRKE